MAAGVDETKHGVAVRSALLLVGDGPFGQRLAGGAHPLLPFVRGLRWVIGGEEKLPAQRTCASLGLQQAQAEAVHRRGWRLAPPVGPVLGQSWVVGDDAALTIWCRTIRVQACLTR